MHNVKACVFTFFTFYILHFVYPGYSAIRCFLYQDVEYSTENDIFRRKNLE